MRKDALDEALGKALRMKDTGQEPMERFRKALLDETTRALPRPRGRLRRLFGLVAATAAAALVAVLLLDGTEEPGGRNAESPEQVSRVADARDIPGFSPEPMASRLYLDPVEYLRKSGADVTVAGLVDLWRRMAAGEDPGIESAKWAVLDALSHRAGNAFGPLLTELFRVDPDPSARRHILLMLTRVRDRAVVPWLDARLSDAPRELLRDVAKARVAHHLPDAASAAALRANAEATGLLDPARPEYVAGRATDLLFALHALGHPDVLDDFGRALAAAPTPDLLFAAWAALGEDPAPEAFRTALDRVASSSLAAEDPSFDDVKVLDLLARTGDERFVVLLAKLLADDYVALAVDAARTAGAWRAKAALPILLDAWERAKRMGEDGEDLIPPVLWAMGRCGDAAAMPRLLAFLRTNDWYRAGEWTVDALLDLEAPVGEILLALPDATWTVGRLPALLQRVTMTDLPAMEGKIATLPDGHLRSALVLARETGAGPETLGYLRTVVDMGGNIGLYLQFDDPDRVSATLDKGSEHDAKAALRAIPILPVSPEEKRKLATVALTGARPGVRAEAAIVLARLGGEEAATALRDRLPEEPAPAVRERIALALIESGSDEARPLLLGEVPADSQLSHILARETLLRTDRATLRKKVAGQKDPLAAGYRLLLSGTRRHARPDPAGDLFDYELAR